MKELIPCPFCGGEDVKITKTIYEDFNLIHRCKIIGAILLEGYLRKEQLIQQWNTQHESKDSK